MVNMNKILQMVHVKYLSLIKFPFNITLVCHHKNGYLKKLKLACKCQHMIKLFKLTALNKIPDPK